MAFNGTSSLLNMMGMGNMVPQLQYGMGGGYPGMGGGYPGMGGGGYPGMTGGYPGMGSTINDLDALLGYGDSKDKFSITEFTTIFKPMIGKGEDAFDDYKQKIEDTIDSLEDDLDGDNLDYYTYYQKSDQLNRLKNRLEVVKELLDTPGALDKLLGSNNKLDEGDFKRIAEIDKSDPFNGDGATISFLTDLAEDYDAPPSFKAGNFKLQELADYLGLNAVSDTFSIYHDNLSTLDSTKLELDDVKDKYFDAKVELNLMEENLDNYSAEEIVLARRKVEALKFLSDENNFNAIARADESNDWTNYEEVPKITLAEIAKVMKAGDLDANNMSGITSGDIKAFKDDAFKVPSKDGKYKADPVLDFIFPTGAATKLNKGQLQARFTQLVGQLATVDNEKDYTAIREALYTIEVLLDNWDNLGSVLGGDGDAATLSRADIEDPDTGLLSGSYIDLDDWI